ncbi:MAG: NAD+ synthase, partial [Desulfobulbaceae bacterium]|nr:NAD+ synthase [Desulfobulbaceae bacterium]
MKIALAQTNPIIGDFSGNSEKVLNKIRLAEEMDCDLVIFPELTLCGYPPQDLLERADFLLAHDRVLEEIIQYVGEVAILIGVPEVRTGPGKPLYNSALFIHEGRVRFRARKQLLPNYDVFDEQRYFESGEGELPYIYNGMRLGITICEDIWYEPGRYSINPVENFFPCRGEKEVDLLINISASPYYLGKLGLRYQVFGELCRYHRTPLLYVNQAGGQDSLLFDGHSMVMNSNGELLLSGRGFDEDLLVWDSELASETCVIVPDPDDDKNVLRGLCMGLRDYLGKSGFKSVVL